LVAVVAPLCIKRLRLATVQLPENSWPIEAEQRSVYDVRGIAPRRRDKEEMYILRIEHPVSDYDAWKAAFDSDPISRERSGVRRYRIMRSTDDPSQVMIDLEFDSLGEAEAVKAALGEVEFDSSSEAEAARAALEDPTAPLEVTHGLRVRINEVVETKAY
jgi:hypothetical protein